MFSCFPKCFLLVHLRDDFCVSLNYDMLLLRFQLWYVINVCDGRKRVLVTLFSPKLL